MRLIASPERTRTTFLRSEVQNRNPVIPLETQSIANGLFFAIYLMRREFVTTTSELAAIAAAAYIGVSAPAMAIGIPMTL